MAAPIVPSRRTMSATGSSRLSLSVGRPAQSPSGTTAGRHPLKHEWALSYVHRPPGAKVEYEKEIRRVATFGSIESFLQIYSHLTPSNELPPVTDVLVFLGRIGRPGVWEEMRDGGKFTLRLAHPVTPILYETLLLSLLGDQFDDADGVVGCVLSVRLVEDILSVWVEEEGDSVRSGELKEKIMSLLSLPPNTLCEYRSNRALLDAASKPFPLNAHVAHPHAEHGHGHGYPHSNDQERGQGHPRHPQQQHHHQREGRDREREGFAGWKESGWDRQRARQ